MEVVLRAPTAQEKENTQDLRGNSIIYFIVNFIMLSSVALYEEKPKGKNQPQECKLKQNSKSSGEIKTPLPKKMYLNRYALKPNSYNVPTAILAYFKQLEIFIFLLIISLHIFWCCMTHGWFTSF